jgi:hypothetical protein
MLGFGQAPTHKSDIQITPSVSSNKQSFVLIFEGLQVDVPPGKSLTPMPTRLLQLAFPLKDGSTGVEIRFAVEGHVFTEEGVTGTLVFSVNGQSIVADFPANLDKDYVQELKSKAPTASECRISVLLLAGRDSKNSDSGGYLNATSLTATIQPSTKKQSSLRRKGRRKGVRLGEGKGAMSKY